MINADPQYIKELVKQNKELKLLLAGTVILLILSVISIYMATDLLLKVI